MILNAKHYTLFYSKPLSAQWKTGNDNVTHTLRVNKKIQLALKIAAILVRFTIFFSITMTDMINYGDYSKFYKPAVGRGADAFGIFFY